MPTPPTILTARRRVHRKRRSVAIVSPPPVALTLVAAAFDPDGVWVILTFDRDISIGGMEPAAIQVIDDVITGSIFSGTGRMLLAPTQVRIDLTFLDNASGGRVLLEATALSGIVAVDDGGTWAGVTDLELPFGE